MRQDPGISVHILRGFSSTLFPWPILIGMLCSYVIFTNTFHIFSLITVSFIISFLLLAKKTLIFWCIKRTMWWRFKADAGVVPSEWISWNLVFLSLKWGQEDLQWGIKGDTGAKNRKSCLGDMAFMCQEAENWSDPKIVDFPQEAHTDRDWPEVVWSFISCCASLCLLCLIQHLQVREQLSP